MWYYIAAKAESAKRALELLLSETEVLETRVSIHKDLIVEFARARNAGMGSADTNETWIAFRCKGPNLDSGQDGLEQVDL